MSPIYNIRSKYIEHMIDKGDDIEVIEAVQMVDGKHLISEGEFSLPITIEGEKIRIHLAKTLVI